MNSLQEPKEPSESELSRRSFMDRSIKAIFAFIGIAMGIPSLGYLISPALQKKEDQWLKLGRTDQAQRGVPTLFTVTLNKTTGWVRAEIKQAYFVYTADGKNFTVMSNICTHLGCQTHWSEDDGYILCPCHGGHFDVRGTVIAGPPPRPLRQLVTRVNADGYIECQET